MDLGSNCAVLSQSAHTSTPREAQVKRESKPGSLSGVSSGNSNTPLGVSTGPLSAGSEFDTESERADSAGTEPIPKKSRLIKTDRPRPFICPICTRGFARQEHLRRHQRSHTNEKPFLCAFCGRCFARRDLVLRHQQKLHAALMDQDKHPDWDGLSKEMKIEYSARHIIEKPGNKESILPTPHTMNLAKLPHKVTKSEREPVSKSGRKNHKLDRASAPAASSGQGSNEQVLAEAHHNYLHHDGLTCTDPACTADHTHSDQHLHTSHPPKKRKRHASFSASTNVSYTQTKDIMSIIKDVSNDVPHQVGFSTPQLTAQELTDKALESGLDIDFSFPPELLLSDPSMGMHETVPSSLTNNNSTVGSGNMNMQIDLGLVSRDLHNKQPFAHGLTPLISDLLTMRSTTAGAGGFVDPSVEQNLDYFNYRADSNNDNNEASARRKSSVSKRKKRFAGHSNTKEQASPNLPLSEAHSSNLIQEFITNMNSSANNTLPPKVENGINTDQAQQGIPNVLSKSNANHQQQFEPPEDERWLSEFINTQMDGNFKVNMSDFNEIGFPDTSPANVNTEFNTAAIYNQPQDSSSQAGSNSVTSNPSSLAHTMSIVNHSLTSPSLVRPVPGPTTIPQDPSQTGTPLDISSLFKSRQVDLFKKIMDTNGISTPGLSPNAVLNGAKPRKGSRLVFFDDKLRQDILTENNLLSTQFPTTEELNTYANLYQDEFHKYFPFIHLHSIKPAMDTYPLLLSICVIGALYGFHSAHAMLLFNISRFHIREFLERTADHHHETPLWLIQSMVLLIFLGIFNNDLTITQTMNTQIMSLIELVKLKQLNLPLENFMTVPIESDHIMEYQDYPELQEQIRKRYRTKEQIEKNFRYFIKAQSRIRTCHTILLISNLFTSLVGLDCCFHSIDLKCGIPCYNERLYFCENASEWSELLANDRIELDSKFSLIQLSNGDETYKNCLIYLTNGHQFFYDNKKVSFKTLLSLLISIHEKIFLERFNLKKEANEQIIEMKWRMNSRPIIESLIKFWEALYLKNGGILQPNENNIQLINNNPALRLIIPLHSFAKMRKCISLTSVMNKIWLKDWSAMNHELENSYSDWESLRETTDYGLNIIKFWIDTVAIVKNAEKTSIRTPIFSITCIFSALLTIAEFLKRMEKKAMSWKRNQFHDTNGSTTSFINYSDRTIWLKSEIILKKVETHLLPKGYNMQSYAEFLRLQANGALDVEVLDDEMAKRAMDPNTDMKETVQVIQQARLSSRSLYLGVRILGDAPIWPIALLFAHALQARAIYNVSTSSA